MTIHSFRHRNYWFRGTARERDTMMAIMRLVHPGDVVYDVGGHIGYLTILFSYLGAHVFVFEPGRNNLPYLRTNVAQMNEVNIVESAVGERIGEAELLIEDLTGQNNSLAGDFQLVANQREARGVKVQTGRQTVPLTTIDHFTSEHPSPDLIKIDIEGYEWQAIQGAEEVLRREKPTLVLELTRNVSEIAAFMRGLGYTVVDERFHPLDPRMPTAEEHTANVIYLHPSRHHGLIASGSEPDRLA